MHCKQGISGNITCGEGNEFENVDFKDNSVCVGFICNLRKCRTFDRKKWSLKVVLIWNGFRLRVKVRSPNLGVGF